MTNETIGRMLRPRAWNLAKRLEKLFFTKARHPSTLRDAADMIITAAGYAKPRRHLMSSLCLTTAKQEIDRILKEAGVPKDADVILWHHEDENQWVVEWDEKQSTQTGDARECNTLPPPPPPPTNVGKEGDTVLRPKGSTE